MNISKISSGNYNPNFGIKYMRPKEWHPEILKTVMDTQLVRQVDVKYPQAQITCMGSSAIKTLNLELRKGVDLDFFAFSIYEPNAIKSACERIQKISLEDIEKHFPNSTSKLTYNEAEDIFDAAEHLNELHEDKLRSPFVKALRKFILKKEVKPKSFDPKAVVEREEIMKRFGIGG